MTKKRVFIILIIVSMLMLACNLGKSSTPTTDEQATSIAATVQMEMTIAALQQATTAAPVVMDTPAPPSDATATTPPEMISTPTNTATQTQVPSSTPVSVACNKAAFVADVTIADDTEIKTGTTFIKTWRLKNTGSCTWTSGYKLVFSHGDRMDAPNEVTLTSGTIPPGGSVDVSVELKAPASDGTYRGNFKLKAPDGQIFGIGASGTGAFYVQIKAITPVAGITFIPILTPLIPLLITDINPTYAGGLDCTGLGYTKSQTFRIENTGSTNIQSAKVVLQDLSAGTTEENQQNSFGSAATCLSLFMDPIEPGNTGFISISGLADLPVGHNMQATIKGCTANDLGGVCKEVTINFISTAP
jgi:hypothetical protein